MKIVKRGFAMKLPLEVLMGMEPGAPQRKGRYETVPLTGEDRAAHARAVAALEELDSNPWIMHGWEGPELMSLEPRERFIPEETHEEHMERVREWWEGRR
jgi:hypothetical protein